MVEVVFIMFISTLLLLAAIVAWGLCGLVCLPIMLLLAKYSIHVRRFLTLEYVFDLKSDFFEEYVKNRFKEDIEKILFLGPINIVIIFFCIITFLMFNFFDFIFDNGNKIKNKFWSKINIDVIINKIIKYLNN